LPNFEAYLACTEEILNTENSILFFDWDIPVPGIIKREMVIPDNSRFKPQCLPDLTERTPVRLYVKFIGEEF